MNEFFVGLDLGTINDYTALSVVERYGEVSEELVPQMWGRNVIGYGKALPAWKFKEFRVWHLDRYLGEPYTQIIDRVRAVLERKELTGARVVVDATGVGRPVVDLLNECGVRPLTPVTITGGDSVTVDHVHGLTEYRVPKRDLVGCLQVLLQNQELKIPATIGLRDELVQEMQNFKVKLSAETGHDSYEHWRSGGHDDLVLSLALACWYPMRHPREDWSRAPVFNG